MEPLNVNGEESKYDCYVLPPKVNSPGFATIFIDREDLLQYSLPTLELQILCIFCLTQVLHMILRKIGLPMLVSQVLAGLILGRSSIRTDYIFKSETIRMLGLLSIFTFQFFMFQSGVKVKVGMVKTAGAKVIFIGIMSVVLPTMLGAAVSRKDDRNSIQELFTATIYSMTSFPVIVQLLGDLRLINTGLGRLTLATALVGDLLSIAIFSILTLMMRVRKLYQKEHHGRLPTLWEILWSPAVITYLCFLVIVVAFLRPALKFVKEKLKDGKHVEDVYAYFVIALFLGCTFLSNYIGHAVIYVAFIIGLAVPSGPPLGSAVVEKFDAISRYFMPLFVTTCAMRVNFGAEFPKFPANLLIPCTAILIATTKFMVCFLSHSCFWKLPTNDACAFALIMCAKGMVELAIYSFHNDSNYVSDAEFAVIVVIVLVLNSGIPPVVRSLYSPAKRYAGYRKKNLADSDPNSDLEIVSCIHVPKDVTATLRLLDGACGGDNILSVTVLHLIKLVAQSTPQLIFHKKERIILCEYPHSENIIRLFNEFEQDNNGISVEAATAVAPTTLIYDDICNIALEKQASLIILPFHQRQSELDGAIESADYAIRDLNCRILDKGPCSVAILVDRYHNTRNLTYEEDPLVSYKIAMIFLGGKDDREALTFALRMAREAKVSLTVTHLVATNDEGDVEDGRGHDEGDDHHLFDDGLVPAKNGGNYHLEEKVQDDMFLRMVHERDYVMYKKEVAGDATVTASVIRTMAKEYELIIVGRRKQVDKSIQTAGLEEWCEFPELGIIGDLILSKDTEGTCSILVVQQ